ncbi:MAG: hypothetical protein ACREO1_10650 [Arenimonas sp.]
MSKDSLDLTDDKLIFHEGHVYFSVYFADEKLIYPFIGSFVYIGEDVVGTETEQTWYFQDCESFARQGSFLDGTIKDGQILGLTKDTASHMATIDKLIPELRRAETRNIDGN